MKSCWLTFLAFMLCVSFMTKAQSFVDVAKLEYRVSPENDYIDTSAFHFDILTAELNILLPLIIDSSNYILAGGTYSELHVDDYRLFSTVLQVGWQRQWNSDWKSTILLLPKMSSAGGKWVKDDFQLGGFLLFSKIRHERFQWKFGAYVNGDRFGPLAVPLLGFKWQACRTWQVDLALPLSLTIRKTFRDKAMAGIVYSGRKFSYNIEESYRYMEVSENFIWAFTDIYLTKNLVFNLRAGYSVLRDYLVYPKNEKVDISFGPADIGDHRIGASNSISQGLSVQGGIIWRVHLDR